MIEKPSAFEGLSDRLANVRRRIQAAAHRSNRPPDQITLIAISKTHPVEDLKAAIALGVTEFGENRVQEAEGKISSLVGSAARWHLVGHLQSNKARRAVRLFDCIHSLDSVDLAQRLELACVAEGRAELPVLIQVDLGGEKTKTGIDPRQLPDLLTAVNSCRRLRLVGVMTLPPYFADPDCARPYFKTLRTLRDELQAKGLFGEQAGELSMGMSHDFEIAIEEGATMVRVGTAIFGERAKPVTDTRSEKS
ncbi:MAG TPA: YggS family pyridoxal phosphate-dependent enzyme [Pyrinomonadaceae bacterium]|nr:YggS family pyridoxal phosphate-dependent enzyme [Pyrinomonadaceae bacterium]